MDAPELTNFGSLIRHAVAMEVATASFYREAARLLGTGPPSEVAMRLAEEHEARRGLLERTRQQKLNEMVLEPISGLDGSRYVFDGTLDSARDVRTKAITLEQTAALLYRESADIAGSLLTEAARTFRKLGEENERNLVRIREAFSG
jgi:rubrerythrin